ncbi:MAG: YihA family ribosome biogenesis GTP-binding protein [Sneathiella sp.]|jgi:GTP-binding protein|uniref:ribosome biogenesis GTP-binding protein YihA/YsxC n=1 Tax=Sneathiella sp. TaxID=1964365 RepID=UPI000C58F405|nr:ribosome biogenesis GTP-binding protein YihA/YsxC [Sneathiella sp.]MAL78873.1 YihA family ribosome biogenesis GTP-binding protein [Sneathiella sp.]|tara:strand:- start:137 stop:799 length:663 start_codon:yes stop_codon:yes gene_type:complete
MTAPTDPADEGHARFIEAGRLLFARECRFIAGAASFDMLPPPGITEVAFAGRSNVGKSSLINALTNRNTLARTSNTPGRTQQINFFDLGGRLYLVDLPGHGYAKASKEKIDIWTDLVNSYLRGRAALRRVLLLVDSRHGLKSSDREVMDMLDTAAVSYQIILTKVDKGNKSDVESLTTKIGEELAKRPASHPEILATSSAKGYGIEMLRAELAALAEEAG